MNHTPPNYNGNPLHCGTSTVFLAIQQTLDEPLALWNCVVCKTTLALPVEALVTA